MTTYKELREAIDAAGMYLAGGICLSDETIRTLREGATQHLATLPREAVVEAWGVSGVMHDESDAKYLVGKSTYLHAVRLTGTATLPGRK